MSDLRELSVRLHDILEMVGASERMRRFHRYIATTHESILTLGLKLRDGTLWNVYRCGSSYEGSVTPDLVSDTDLIYCPSDVLVVATPHMIGPEKHLLIVKDSWTRPGYVKLQHITNRQQQTIYNKQLCSCSCQACIHLDFDRAGRVCLKHFPAENMHGPAHFYDNSQRWHFLDTIFAYKCRGIPLFAIDWITRHRKYGWPSQQQIDEMKEMGCVLVGAGYYCSPEKHIEWRLSFSLQERMLMKNLLPVQHKVYILLKLVKKDVLEKRLKTESLTSYHCKTCVFYMAETTPAHFWTADNLIICLLQCLKLLLDWVRDRFCPSFFLKDQNLFDKEGFSTVVGPLEMLLNSLLQMGHTLLFLIDSDCVGHMMRDGKLEMHRAISDTELNRYIAGWKLDLAFAPLATYDLLITLSKSTQDPLSFFMSKLNDLQQYGTIPCNSDETKAALRYVLPWLHFVIGKEFAARAIACNSNRGKALMKQSDSHFQQARDTNFASVKLAQATILLKVGKLDECFELLQELESKWTHHVKTVCGRRCQPVSFSGEQPDDEMLSVWRDMSMKNLMRKYTVSRVIFLQSQIGLVPPPLCFEMFRSLGTQSGSERQNHVDCASVDAKVYLYFLQYLVSSKLIRERQKQVAMDNLASVLHAGRLEDIRYRDTAFNLLGWVYSQEHRAADAVWCLVQSWRIRPHHNAAKLHMLDMCFRLAQARSHNVS